MSVNSAGATFDNDYTLSFSNYGARIHFDSGNGLIYSDTGQTINPLTGNPLQQFFEDGPMTPDSSINRAFFVDLNGDVMAFNQATFSEISSFTVPNIDFPLRMIRWGTNGIAFNTLDGSVYLIGSAISQVNRPFKRGVPVARVEHDHRILVRRFLGSDLGREPEGALNQDSPVPHYYRSI